jgi:hypothetical protein
VRHAAAERALEAVDTELQQLDVEEAQLIRLLRAHETLGLAAALQKRGGPGFADYQTLLACERHVPAQGAPATPGR